MFKTSRVPCGVCGGQGTIEIVNPAWLRARRKAAKLSLRELATRSGLSAPYLCDVERGYRRCTDTVKQVYQKLNGK